MTSSRLCIVYADDDELVRTTVTSLLIEAGVDVHACVDGGEAVTLCQDIRPHAVLLDLNMPDVDGLQAAQRIRSIPSLARVRLVAITGRGTWELRNKALNAGFDEFLIKPVATETLLEALGRVNDSDHR